MSIYVRSTIYLIDVSKNSLLYFSDDDFYAGCAVDFRSISGNNTLENDCISTCALQGEAFALLGKTDHVFDVKL